MPFVIANYQEQRAAFRALLEPDCTTNILLFSGASGTGKTTLLEACLAEIPAHIAAVPIQLRGSTNTVPEIFRRVGERRGWDAMPAFIAAMQPLPRVEIDNNRLIGIGNQINIALNVSPADREEHRAALTEAWFNDLRTFDTPFLIVIDTYEAAIPEVQEWLAGSFLRHVANTPTLRVLIAGQTVPDPHNVEWGRNCFHYRMYGVPEAIHWLPVIEDLGRYIPAPDSLSWLAGICHACKGIPRDIMQIIEGLPQIDYIRDDDKVYQALGQRSPDINTAYALLREMDFASAITILEKAPHRVAEGQSYKDLYNRIRDDLKTSITESIKTLKYAQAITQGELLRRIPFLDGATREWIASLPDMRRTTLDVKLQEAKNALYRNDRETIESALEDAKAVAEPDSDPRIDTFFAWARRDSLLYAQIWHFFDEAGYEMRELESGAFLLSPSSPNHPLMRLGALYMQLFVEHSPTGDNFSAIAQAACEYYGNDLTHSIAIAVSDQRPVPGARYRLYEIRQQNGLVIVPLDGALFTQVNPERSANDILISMIEQATGQQDLYALSTPVSDDLSFFGRERVLQEIVDNLDIGQSIGLFGLRKMGKTSLIQRLKGLLALRRPVALVDTQKTARHQGIWALYPDIITAFATHIQHYQPSITLSGLHLWPEPVAMSPALAEAFVQDVQTLHRMLGEPDKDKRLLLVVDEADRLLPLEKSPGYEGYNIFFAQLRALNQQAQMLDLLVVGVDAAINRIERWHTLGLDNELYRALYEVWLPPMAYADVCEMLESLGSQMGVRYESEALHLLAHSGGGQPFVTRQMCSQAVEGRLGCGTITVTLEQAQTAIEEFIFNDSYIKEMWQKRLDATQREMLCKLARSQESLPRLALLPHSQRQEVLASLSALEDYTLIRREEGNYTIAWDVFRKWIRWIELGLEE